MTAPVSNTRNAARLVYKAMHSALVPVNDVEYRQLLALHRADPSFSTLVQDIAEGMELSVLDSSERGLVLVPASRDSKFALRMTDLRANMSPDQKAALVLAHLAIAAAFFPTTDGLEDDNHVPPPVSVATCRNALQALAQHLQSSTAVPSDVADSLSQGWQCVLALPVALPTGQRAAMSSIVGLVKLAFLNLAQHGLVRVDRESDDDATMTYTATWRLRVQLRELGMRRLYELSQLALAHTSNNT